MDVHGFSLDLCFQKLRDSKRWASRWDGVSCSRMMELPWVQASSALAPSPARGTPRWSQGTLLAYLSLVLPQGIVLAPPSLMLEHLRRHQNQVLLHALIFLLIVMELTFHQTLIGHYAILGLKMSVMSLTCKLLWRRQVKRGFFAATKAQKAPTHTWSPHYLCL